MFKFTILWNVEMLYLAIFQKRYLFIFFFFTKAFLCCLFSLQPWLKLRGHDQQVAISLGKDLFQLDLHCPVCVDTGGSSSPGQQRLWLKYKEPQLIDATMLCSIGFVSVKSVKEQIYVTTRGFKGALRLVGRIQDCFWLWLVPGIFCSFHGAGKNRLDKNLVEMCPAPDLSVTQSVLI